jgi:hypothetical protein
LEKRIIAGVFLLLSSLAGMAHGIMNLLWSMESSDAWSADFYERWAAIYLILSTVTFFGALFAFSGASFGLPILGAITGLLASGPLWLGAIFGLVALILLIKSKPEFDEIAERKRQEAEMASEATSDDDRSRHRPQRNEPPLPPRP